MNVQLCVESYHSVFACLQGVTLQQTDKNHLHDQESVTHPNAVTRTDAKGDVHVGVYLLPTVFTEPAHADRDVDQNSTNF